MAARKPNKLATVIHWKNDLASFNKVKKEARDFKKELAGLYKNIGKMPSPTSPSDGQPRGGGGSPSRRRGVGDDAHIKIFRERQKQQDKFTKSQDKSIKNFLISNKIIRGMTKEEQDKLVVQLKQAKTQEELNFKIREQKALLIDNERRRRQELRLMQKQNFLQDRLTASSKQMVGNYVSAFAVGAGVTGITKIGQDFERAENTLTAITGSTEAATAEMEYLKELTFNMGVPLRETAKDYSKLMASSKDMLSDQQLKSLFEDLTMSSVVMGTSAEDTSGILKALSQMLAKQKISAEEYRGQMGDRMPIAIQAMTKASVEAGVVTDELVAKYGSASAAMEKLMADGKLYSKDILPFFGKEIRKVVESGYDRALNSNMNAMNRLKNVTENTANEFFKSGFSDGLTDFFNTSAQSLKDLTPLAKSFGRIMGSLFHALSRGVQLVTAPLRVFGMVLDRVTEVMGDFSALLGVGGAAWMIHKRFGLIGKAIGAMAASTGKMGKFFTAMKVGLVALARYLAPVILAFGALEELMNFFYGDGSKRSVLGTYDEFTNNRESNKAIMQQPDKFSLGERISASIREVFGERLAVFKPGLDFILGTEGKQTVDINIRSDVNSNGNITNFVDSRVDEKVGNMIGEGMSGLAGGQ